MNWADLKGLTVKNVYYDDQGDSPGIYMEKSKAHYLPEGYILLELTSSEYNDSVFVLLERDMEKDGIKPYEVDASKADEFHKINVKSDRIWSTISNKKIHNTVLHTGHYFFGNTKKEIILHIELIFQHGERLFISSADFNAEGEMEESLYDFVIHRNGKGVMSDE